MCNFLLQIGGEIDDSDGAERAFLDADTATDTEVLRNERNFLCGRNFDTELSCSDNWTGLLTFLSAFLLSWC